MVGWGIVGGLVMIAAGAAVLYVARLGAEGRLHRNYWAGIRFPSTLRSDEAWQAAHLAAAPSLRWAGESALIGGIVGTVALVLGSPAVFVVALLAGAIGLIAFALASTVVGVKAARRA